MKQTMSCYQFFLELSLPSHLRLFSHLVMCKLDHVCCLPDSLPELFELNFKGVILLSAVPFGSGIRFR